MPKSELMPMKVVVMGLCLSLSSWMAPQALAFDPQSGVSKESGPFDLFKFGFFSYKEGRKRDAVEAYRTALDFTTPLQSQSQIYCDLGLAYVAANRMNEAVDAFDHAAADDAFAFTPEAQASYDAARKAVEALA